MGLFSSGKRKKVGCWIEHAHLFSGSTYECSLCHRSYKATSGRCPGCGAEMRKGKYDPQWVDELEMMDAIFDD
ncbi:hypothetical protein SAMN02910456_02601 [Ruminococcaceae bacterium YRB3002]|nr:hypothetical protein SAMN02910456_02601 [Ruminococcaceae bacterium YRB3002]